jgi:hypothetical protein
MKVYLNYLKINILYSLIVSTFYIIYPSKNISMNMATIGGQNMQEATLFMIQ